MILKLMLTFVMGPFLSACGNEVDMKTYMSYDAITAQNSPQYRFREANSFEVNEYGIYELDGFMGVALGNHYGEIGDKLELTFSSGQTLKVVILDHKHEGCNSGDGSMVEFVVNTNQMPLEYKRNNYQGLFKGPIKEYRKVLKEIIKEYDVLVEDTSQFIPIGSERKHEAKHRHGTLQMKVSSFEKHLPQQVEHILEGFMENIVYGIQTKSERLKALEKWKKELLKLYGRV